ncbi:MAG: ABC transporter ATP-binding protein [Comamonadaceae bacterium]|nr:MAG: ABC transporter ATP-binding protein [Comamonadaceae bacterium]
MFRTSHEQSLLEVNNLRVDYSGSQGRVTRAVNDVSLSLKPRETLGIVGESGSGKTTLGRAVLGLTPVTSGSIVFEGVDITRASYKQRRALSSRLQVVFQDPYSSLNPTRTIGQTLAESLRHHSGLRREEVAERVGSMLERVGLPAQAAERFPGRFSGGQRQRIAIARALMSQPRLVICDEAVSALDLSVQAQILNLLRELQDDFDLSYLFIAHDLDVVRFLSDRILVMHQGREIEQGQADQVYETPKDPYTRALIDAVPVPDPDEQRRRREARWSWREQAV